MKKISVIVKRMITGNNVNPVAVNFHFTRDCNFKCEFCFNQYKPGRNSLAPIEIAKDGLRKIKMGGTKKINLSGGEPLLHKEYLSELLKYCKEELDVECMSIITNGSLLDEAFLKENHQYLDVVGISIDSFNPETLKKIGRKEVDIFEKRDLLEKYNINFKINTVVSRYNYQEDMVEQMKELDMFRWKVFQVMTVYDENEEEAKNFSITSNEFNQFIDKHKEIKALIPLPNDFCDSYLVFNEKFELLNSETKIPGKSLQEESFEEVLKDSNFNEIHFEQRHGNYDWSKKKMKNKNIEV